MGFEHIETLKRQYTDQFVVVDDHRPELARFRGVTGQVKTINMNGRALVEFQDYIANIGWYDIELDFLTVVPKPDPEAAKAAAKPAAKPAAAKAAPTEPAAKAKPAAKPAAAAPAPAKAVGGAKPAAGKMSTAEILAASRAKKAVEAAASAPEATAAVAAAPTAAPEPAAAPVKPAPKPAAVGPIGKLTTTAEKIAACRRIDAKS